MVMLLLLLERNEEKADEKKRRRTKRWEEGVLPHWEGMGVARIEPGKGTDLFNPTFLSQRDEDNGPNDRGRVGVRPI